MTAYEDIVSRLRHCPDTVTAAECAEAIQELAEQHEADQAEIAWLKKCVAELPKPQKWISAKERLPEHEYGESTSVLTVDLYGAMRVTYFDGGNWCWPSGEALTTMRVAPITHWMPMPEPPKEET